MGRTIRTGKGSRYIEQTLNYYAYRDAGAGFTSPNYGNAAGCTSALDAYKSPLSANMDAWVSANMEAPILAIETIPGNWATALAPKPAFRPLPYGSQH